VEQNFRYAAHRFINDWLGWDKHCHAALCPHDIGSVDIAMGASTLVEVAKNYAVIVCFRQACVTPCESHC
jgi:hypothetical protein